MVDEIPTVEEVVCRELQQLRQAERYLCAAFQKLPSERVPANLIICLLYQLAQANEHLDRIETLLDIMEKLPVRNGDSGSLSESETFACR